MLPKIMVSPNHPLKNRVFHYFLHPFWGKKTLFLETSIYLPLVIPCVTSPTSTPKFSKMTSKFLAMTPHRNDLGEMVNPRGWQKHWLFKRQRSYSPKQKTAILSYPKVHDFFLACSAVQLFGVQLWAEALRTPKSTLRVDGVSAFR